MFFIIWNVKTIHRQRRGWDVSDTPFALTFFKDNDFFCKMLYIRIVLKSFKYSISPTTTQAELINKHIGSTRFVFEGDPIKRKSF